MDCWGSCWAVLMGKISQAERWILFVMLCRPPSTIGQGGILCCTLSLSELSWHCVSAPAAPASIFQAQAHRTYIACTRTHTLTHTHALAAATESQTIIRECLFFSIPPVFPNLPHSVSVNVLRSYYPYPSHTRMPKQHWRGGKKKDRELGWSGEVVVANKWGLHDTGVGEKEVWGERVKDARRICRGVKSFFVLDALETAEITTIRPSFRGKERLSVCVWVRERERRRERHQALVCLAYWTGSSGRDIVETLYVFTLHRHLFSSPVQIHQWTVTNCELVHQSDAHRLYDVIWRL